MFKTSDDVLMDWEKEMMLKWHFFNFLEICSESLPVTLMYKVSTSKGNYIEIAKLRFLNSADDIDKVESIHFQ